MKLFYLEDGIFPATYNFKDELGLTGTDIGFVDMANLYNGACEIVGSWQGHRNVLQFQDDATAGEDPDFTHNETQATAGTRELFIGTNNVTEYWEFMYHETGPGNIIRFLITSSKLYYMDSVDVLQEIQAVTNDILYHLKVVWRADNTFDVYVDGILKVDNQATNNNMVSGIMGLYWRAKGDSIDYLYLDAYGDPDNDADYNIGDNREVDWHVYNKEEITNIREYPFISQKLNAYTMCNAVIADFEGALFDSWYARDFNKILIEDDSSNIMFRGYLIKKIFTKIDLTLYFAGIGILLDWRPFGSEGVMNYILAYGLVDLPIEATSILTLKKEAGGAMGWDADWWIKEGRDVGVLIVDKAEVNTRAWDSSAISQEGGSVKAGNNASTLGFLDNNYYNVRDSTVGNPDMIITPTIDGVVVDDTDFLKSIEIQYNFRMKIFVGIFARNYARCRLQILKDTKWTTIRSVAFDRYWGSHTSAWKMGVPSDEYVGGNDGEWYAPDDTDTELRKYFNKDNGHYSELKGMRFILNGDIKTDGYVEVHVDYIKVKVGYTTDDISPIMETITDSAPSTITCSGVAKWDETGVVENDGFKIGENTRVIVQDIASESGLNIEIIDPHDEEESDITILCDTDTDCNWQLAVAPDHHTAVSDDAVPTYIYGADADDGKIEVFGMATTTLTRGYVHKIRVYLKGNQTCGSGPTATIWNGVSWETPQEVELTGVVAWHYVEFTGLYLEQVEINDLLLKLTLPTIDGEDYVAVQEVKVHVYEAYPTFNKYMAREFKGDNCMEPLKAVCKLEGTIWYEDYINDKIVVVKPTNLVDSEVDLTEDDYDNCEYEDDCNQVKGFYVFGKSEDKIFAKAIDETISGYKIEKYIDESITNVADAQDVANEQLALVNSKRPSIRLPLNADNVALQLGTTVDVTFARPTITKAAYPIRKIERSKFGIIGIQTDLYLGFGESTMEEDVAKAIRDNAFRSHKSQTDRLISP